MCQKINAGWTVRTTPSQPELVNVTRMSSDDSLPATIAPQGTAASSESLNFAGVTASATIFTVVTASLAMVRAPVLASVASPLTVTGAGMFELLPTNMYV